MRFVVRANQLRWLHRMICRIPELTTTLSFFAFCLVLPNFYITLIVEFIRIFRNRAVLGPEGYLLGVSTSLGMLLPFLAHFAIRLHRQILLDRCGQAVEARLLRVYSPILLRFGFFKRKLRLHYEFDTEEGERIAASSLATHREAFRDRAASESVLIKYLPWDPSICDLAVSIQKKES